MLRRGILLIFFILKLLLITKLFHSARKTKLIVLGSADFLSVFFVSLFAFRYSQESFVFGTY